MLSWRWINNMSLIIMEKYEYKVVSVKVNWAGRMKVDYLDILNEYGNDGWRFVNFTPSTIKPTVTSELEIIFERKKNNN